MGEVQPAEQDLIRTLADELQRFIPTEARVVAPLAIGGHVDHRLTRRAVDLLGMDFWYYADYPYTAHWIARPYGSSEEFPRMPGGKISVKARNLYTQMQADGWADTTFPISQPALEAWQRSVAAHASQISTFWPDLELMRQAIQAYCQAVGGIRLWKQPALRQA
jgi:LmbE family N-acetylglucosaminyl deacetylase